MIRVVLVDDHLEFRWITRCLLALDPELEVVGEAGNGLEALDVVAQIQPDVVLMDVQMPLLDGIATTKRMRVAYPDVQIVLFTGGDDGAVLDGVRAGAVRYLCKTTPQAELVAALRAAHRPNSP
ncbi:MAG TPA: response regulator transcription factor [Herpetosiphonaceae bacterium]